MDLYFSEIEINFISIYTKIIIFFLLKYVFISFINAFTFKIIIACMLLLHVYSIIRVNQLISNQLLDTFPWVYVHAPSVSLSIDNKYIPVI